MHAGSLAKARRMSRERSVLRMIAWRRPCLWKARFPKQALLFSFESRRKPAHEQEAKRIANGSVRRDRMSKKRSELRMAAWRNPNRRKPAQREGAKWIRAGSGHSHSHLYKLSSPFYNKINYFRKAVYK